jgi:hypothetical protein
VTPQIAPSTVMRHGSPCCAPGNNSHDRSGCGTYRRKAIFESVQKEAVSLSGTKPDLSKSAEARGLSETPGTVPAGPGCLVDLPVRADLPVLGVWQRP